MKTITGTIDAYLTEYCHLTPEDLRGPKPGIVGQLSYSSHDMSGCWVKVGTARIEVTLMQDDAIVTGAVAGLRAQQEKARADAEAKCTEIERQIQTLLAITFEPA